MTGFDEEIVPEPADIGVQNLGLILNELKKRLQGVALRRIALAVYGGHEFVDWIHFTESAHGC